jgi:hypothetical protein
VSEYTAYKGTHFEIEWFFDENDKSEVLEYFKELSLPLQVKTMALFERMAVFGEIRVHTKFNSEGDGLYAFKPIPHRFICFFVKGRKIMITNAFHKKTEKLPKNEKDRALRRKTNYEARAKKGIYYKSNI